MEREGEYKPSLLPIPSLALLPLLLLLLLLPPPLQLERRAERVHPKHVAMPRNTQSSSSPWKENSSLGFRQIKTSEGASAASPPRGAGGAPLAEGEADDGGGRTLGTVNRDAFSRWWAEGGDGERGGDPLLSRDCR